ncbi:MAG TPA: hypothetical protein VFA47_01630 [Candidatus Manganitrophaceae bacterium]|nr:hypothetical protein [Candidatus Manganitrophaceae bacterium]
MRELIVSLPCGKDLRFYIEDESVRCSNPRVLSALAVGGVDHFDGHRYYPGDGERFLEALHDFYWLKGVPIETS